MAGDEHSDHSDPNKMSQQTSRRGISHIHLQYQNQKQNCGTFPWVCHPYQIFRDDKLRSSLWKTGVQSLSLHAYDSLLFSSQALHTCTGFTAQQNRRYFTQACFTLEAPQHKQWTLVSDLVPLSTALASCVVPWLSLWDVHKFWCPVIIYHGAPHLKRDVVTCVMHPVDSMCALAQGKGKDTHTHTHTHEQSNAKQARLLSEQMGAISLCGVGCFSMNTGDAIFTLDASRPASLHHPMGQVVPHISDLVQGTQVTGVTAQAAVCAGKMRLQGGRHAGQLHTPHWKALGFYQP